MITLLLAVAQTKVSLQDEHNVGYNSTVYEAACGQHVFQIAFRNGSNRVRPGYPKGDWGRVNRFVIDGKPVEDGAKGLEARVAGRFIDRAGIGNCGYSERNPVFQGVLQTSELESKLMGLAPRIYFKLRREGGKWRIVFE